MNQLRSKFLISFLFIFIPILSFGQDQESLIQTIRDRYYRINGIDANLKKVSILDTDFYIEDDKISIAKKETEDGRYEFYFESNNNEYFPYFIFFEPNDNNGIQLRAYYDDDSNLILLKEGKLEKVFNQFDKNPYAYLKQDAHNAINLFANIFLLSQHPNDNRARLILKQANDIKQQIGQGDTLENKSDEGGRSGTIIYKNEKSLTIMKSTYEVSEHHSRILNEYFQNNKLIYSTEEIEQWVGFYSKLIGNARFYDNEKLFRLDKFIQETNGKLYSKNNDEYCFENFKFININPKVNILK